ncbi:S8 family serine peptidase [Amycolatopsis balhimycina]|uniref:S8 family serine peptidase n=1 Tax=Amycolatopsis balhimycina TaxID=208443 RepID=UPI0003752A13|nr:S8 family serine peptidase [Amycolatopsis balhimycina]
MASTKLDAALASRVHGARARVAEELPERVRVLVHVTGDLHAVEEAGLWVELVAGPVVTGTIAVDDLEAVAELPDVAYVSSDRIRLSHLNKSVPAMHGDAARTIPPGFSGKGVVVGVVDSGIDIFHGSFRTPSTGKTRIHSLLDLTQRHTMAVTGTGTGNPVGLRWRPPPLPHEKVPSGPANTTAPLPLTATKEQVQAALLAAFPSIKAEDIEVTGGPWPGTAIVVDFVGKYAPNVYDTGRIASFVPTGTGASGISIIRGREFVREEIDLGLSLPIQPYLSRDVDGHGTHVAGIAAGNGAQKGNCHGAGRYVGVAPEADLIIVRRTGFDSDILRGVKYIFDTAAALGKPAVVNMSFGNNLGPHDGTDTLDIGLDGQLTGTTKRMIVTSAGNDGAVLDPVNPVVGGALYPAGGGVHARKTVPAHTAANAPVTVRVVVATTDDRADKEDDFLDLWYPGAGQLDVDLVAPGNAGSFGRTGLTGQTAKPVAGHPVTIQSVRNASPKGTHLIRITIAPRAGSTIAMGEWTVKLWETAGTATIFDCWIPVTTEDVHPRFHLEDQVRTRTVHSPGTANLPITVGAYNPDDHQVAETSARGSTADGRTKPELCAPGVDITSALNRGESSGGSWCECCYDFYQTESGTSQAAPHVTGVVALMFEMNPNLSHAQVKDFLQRTCDPPDPNPHLPNGEDGYGFGLVNAEKAVKAAKPQAVSLGGEPIVLSPAAYFPVAGRARRLRDRVGRSPEGRLIAALVSEHVDEVRRLIDTDRRVLVAWHRMHGPVLLRLLVSDVDRDVPVPVRLGGRPVAEGLARFLDALARAGSPALRAAVAEHREGVLGLPGRWFPPADDAKAS